MLDEPGVIRRTGAEQPAFPPMDRDAAGRGAPDEVLLSGLEALRAIGRHRSPAQRSANQEETS
ncbi:hypothetical protein BFF78_27965 [Streptomyces fodineus]|uniref:Uncharacterized protein n=1 Tax=Streptomyces fodineus TaxID=1904616 RepID=A0A1D7YFI6_9ACTN|nr:hypothetical protein [Streptomyces fodineus]AOR34377.1 hypothetical protein BFF78_27965 [Streptomyces fodineus]